MLLPAYTLHYLTREAHNTHQTGSVQMDDLQAARIAANKKRVQEAGGMAAVGRKIGISRQAVWKVLEELTTRQTARYSLAKALGVPVSKLWPEDRAA